MEREVNRRGRTEHFVVGSHLNLTDLRVQRGRHRYLSKENIPRYPRPEFHVTHLIHNTDEDGLCGIRKDEGFRDPFGPHPPRTPKLLWWNLKVTHEDIRSAERRLLEKKYPEWTEEQVQNQQSFLEKFATSPSFMDTSRLGSYRFTFTLEEVLTAYSQQLCSGAQPKMRVFKTVLYRQEVMYAVLVHSPANDKQFSKYPPLTDDPNAICSYRDGHFIWRSEAMCNTHRYRLVERRDENQMEAEELFGNDVEYYVWDNVAVALHVADGQVLKFDPDKLRNKLTYCKRGAAAFTDGFDDYISAQTLVEELWPGSNVLDKEVSNT